MKRMIRVGLLGLSLCGGCIFRSQHEVITQHEVKPIHITMDINVKVQKDLESFLDLED